MYSCYTEAFNYLSEKYGQKKLQMTSAGVERLRKARNKEEYEKINNDPYNYCFTLNTISQDNWDDYEISILIQQYYSLSYEPRKELYYKLIRMGIIKVTAEA